MPVGTREGQCPRCIMAEIIAPTHAGEPAAPVPTLTPEQLAPHFPQLEILECLGRGGMGVVYKARQKSLNRLVALKLLAPERVTDAQFAERFAREAQALAALNHPHIVTVHDFGVVDAAVPQPEGAPGSAPVPHAKMFFLLMEFVDGVNLRQAMKAGRFTPEQALAIVPPVCEALQYAHEHGIVHRDIKPENLLLDKEGRVKIADFGIAKMLGAPLSEPAAGDGEPNTPNQSSVLQGDATLASVAGTPQYMAPEQKAHRATDHRADIYSLGVVLYELLTGELPADSLQPPSRKVQIDVRLDEIVLRALEKSPELRYQTAGEFRTQVEAVVVSQAVAPAAASVGNSSPSRISRMAIVGACWMLFIFALVPLYLSLQSDGGHAGPAWLAYVTMALGFTAPFGTTILGWIAVSQIRRSAGSLYGLGLAVFDGLLFPLLALDGLIFGLFKYLTRIVVGFYANPSVMGDPRIDPPFLTRLANDLANQGASATFVAIATVIMILVVDFFIIRAVWRAVNRAQATPVTHSPAAHPQPRWQGWDVWVIGLCLAIFGALWLLQLSEGPLLNRSLFAGAGVGSNVVLPVALATTILLAGAAFLYMLARNIKTAAPTRAESWKRTVGRAIVPAIAVALLLRTFVIHAFVVPNNSMSPEITKGSRILVWKLTSTYAPGDIVAYRHEDKIWVARVMQVGPAMLTLQKNSKSNSEVQREAVVGKVISVFWRPSPGAAESESSEKSAALNRSGPVFSYTISARTTGGKPLEAGGFADVFVNIHGSDPSNTEERPLVRGAKVTKITDSDPTISNYRVVQLELELTQIEVDRIKLHAFRHSFTFRPAAATAEPWSPSPAPVTIEEVRQISTDAKALQELGRYEEALQRHLWLHHQALEIAPSLFGLRMSFWLSDWAELAQRFPKAKQALIEIRDQKTRELAAGRGDLGLFIDVDRINSDLRDDGATLALSKQIEQADPELAKQCAPLLEGAAARLFGQVERVTTPSQWPLEKALADLQAAKAERDLLPSKSFPSEAHKETEALKLARKVELFEENAARRRAQLEQSLPKP